MEMNSNRTWRARTNEDNNRQIEGEDNMGKSKEIDKQSKEIDK